ncbi:MAG: hypothetical protein HW389_2532 [Bacteroidetes bacterium]|nr:hypothetical protein [Bacteroidota bacterium]
MMKRIFVVTLIMAVGIILLFEESMAIPAFARKYNMSCNVCHSPFPKLKPFGEEFAGNGLVLKDKEPPRFTIDTGDELLLLMREIPLAIRVEGYLRHQPQTVRRSDLQTPYLVKLISGGQVARNVSYYFYFFLGERGEVAGLEDAFVMFNNIFGQDLDVVVGQFQVSDPLFKRELRLTFEDYQIYRAKAGISSVNLTYDRGVMMTYALPTSTDIVLEVLNGNGIGAADAVRSFDDDTYKNGMLRITQDVGESFRIGAFGYLGNQEKNGFVNKTTMWGPDLTFSLDPVEINVQYVARTDDKPLFTPASIEQKTDGGIAEFVYRPEGDRSRWYGVFLYNWVNSDDARLNYRTASAHAGYLVGRNFRVLGEYTYDLEQKANRFTAGFVAAF